MSQFKNLAMLIYGNTLALSAGIKMLFVAAAFAVVMQYTGASSQISWALALTCVILTTCLVTKFRVLTGKQR